MESLRQRGTDRAFVRVVLSFVFTPLVLVAAQTNGGVGQDLPEQSAFPGHGSRQATALGYRPVRRVHVQIQTWNGSWQRNPLGLAPWWALDQPPEKAVDKLRQEIERLADHAGVRYFVLHLPAGSVPPRMCASQFWPMPKRRRELLARMSRSVKANHPDIRLGVYCGWGLDPTPATTDMTGWRYPDWQSVQDRAAILHQYAGWRDIGFDFLVLDAIVPQNWRDGTAVTWLRYIEKQCGLRTIGEAYPLTKKGRGNLDRTALNQHAWMGLKRFIDLHGIKGDLVAARYMGLNGNAKGWKEGQKERLAMIADCVRRGFIPWVYRYGTVRERIELCRFAVEELARMEARKRSRTVE